MRKKNIPGIFFLFLANLLWILTIWLNKQFPNLDFSSIIFHLKMPLDGSNTSAFTNIIILCCISVPLLTILAFLSTLPFRNLSPNNKVLKLKKSIPITFWRHHFFSLCCIFLCITFTICIFRTGLSTYLYNNLHSSTIYEEEYVDPKTANITFPEKKRNLIYIVMESMETTYADEKFGGYEYGNFIPELCDLQKENINFSTSHNTLNGAFSTAGTTWTIGALVAQTSGIPLTIPVDGNAMGEYDSEFLPGAYSIGEILADNGYQQEFLLGSDAVFGGRDLYFSQHGDYYINDYYQAIEDKRISEDYYVWWGYEDAKLYEYAKEELTRLSESDQPFNLTMLTVDTHFFDGFYCDVCLPVFPEDKYASVIACGSRQVYNFVQWLQEQPFYENTTIIISGDHPTMDSEYIYDTCSPDLTEYDRKTYTLIINSAQDYELNKTRTFTTMDMYPTTLASLGCTIEGERLGLGTNLFSNTPTLAEKMGIEQLNSELEKTSRFYNKNLLYK